MEKRKIAGSERITTRKMSETQRKIHFNSQRQTLQELPDEEIRRTKTTTLLCYIIPVCERSCQET